MARLVGALVLLVVGTAVLVRLRRSQARRARWQALRSPDAHQPRPRAADVRGWLLRWPLLVSGSAVLIVAAVGFAVGGPVLAVVLAAYLGGAVVVVRRRLLRQQQLAARREVVDAVAGLAADLRAGLGVARAMTAVEPAVDRAVVAGAEAAVVAMRISGAVAVAQTSGAPLADVLERLDTHLRAVDRARATAAAQAAGAHASAGLLAILPVAGVGLGSVIGVDPWAVLLRTPVGAAALLVAVTLQLLGLVWAARLARVEVSV
jgi:tight adherence protein B